MFHSVRRTKRNAISRLTRIGKQSHSNLIDFSFICLYLFEYCPHIIYERFFLQWMQIKNRKENRIFQLPQLDDKKKWNEIEIICESKVKKDISHKTEKTRKIYSKQSQKEDV